VPHSFPDDIENSDPSAVLYAASRYTDGNTAALITCHSTVYIAFQDFFGFV
jgi:hypothetical protein